MSDSMDGEVLEVVQKVHKFFRKKGLTLSVAESCTGGLISHYITTLPGASIFFKAGVISYSIESKKIILGVTPETISRHGGVSKEAAVEMAEKVRSLTRTDYSVSTTGNLGPDVLDNKERGIIFIAVSKKGQTLSRELRLTGDRGDNKMNASLSALRFLIEVAERQLG